ncbi:MAG: winged helix-turn-helix domain-containing protein [Gemmatimonadales bacterium]|nr:winged helix-turn-helix domain-containing protein [Gemmatimonadales bacterium]
MNHSQEFRPPFSLGDWIVLPGLNRIQGPEGEIQVEPRVMQVLLRLAERPGQVCSRLGLLEDVWGDAVVGEENLTRAISELRRIFGDRARQPRVIETIRNHGYRLLLETGQVSPAPSAREVAQSESRPARKFLIPLTLLLGLTLVLVAVLGSHLLHRGGNSSQPSETIGIQDVTFRPETSPMTSFTGREWHPALSPDGLRIAFIWAGPEGNNIDVYLKQRNSETILRLTDDPGWAAWPTWSSDGQTVAFVQQSDSLSCLCTVSSLGGTIRTLLEVESWVEGLDWSPDGACLVFSTRSSGESHHSLYRLDLDDLKVQSVSIDRSDGAGNFLPRISPDGRTLAWIGIGLTGSSGVFLAPLQGGKARMLTGGMTELQGLAWTADGSGIVFAEAHAGLFNLWRVILPDGYDPLADDGILSAEWLPTPGDFAWNPTVARQSGELVYEQVLVDQDIWRLEILASDPWQLESGPFLRSTRWESAAAFSPEGGRVVFVSSRSGSPEIWTCDAEGGNLQRLTQAGFASIANPRWSPDGMSIAANVIRDGLSAVMVIASRGGPFRIMTATGLAEVFSSWSRSGGLLVGSDVDGQWQVYELDPESGQRIARTSGGGLVAMESRDGEDLFFTRPGLRGLWRASRDMGGPPDLVVAQLDHRDRNNWAVLEEKIAWVMRTSGSAFLVFQEIESGASTILAELPDIAESGLSISPDGKIIFYTRTRASEGDLMLLEGFRGTF